MPDFEINPRYRGLTGRCRFGYDLSCVYEFTHGCSQLAVMAVQRHEPFTVIDHHQLAVAAKPIGEYHLPGENCVNRLTFAGFKQQPLPFQTTVCPPVTESGAQRRGEGK